MKRGRLKVLLGAAPGVGKTYEMLEEGRRLQGEGVDVVIGVVETHGRAATLALTEGLPQVSRVTTRTAESPSPRWTSMGCSPAAPSWLWSTNSRIPTRRGHVTQKRWQDVQDLLEAGIDVITTVNIQHIESLNGVVETITGVVQRETLPDWVVRAADQIEVVDLAPQSLRDRLAAGTIYPAERIDAALSNYFRLGNLTALRELALLWLADEVDSALNDYRAEHGIDCTWQTRERVVVALTGGPEGETLVRRGARIAARSAGGQLLAVHVTGRTACARDARTCSRSSAPWSSPSAAATTRWWAMTSPRARGVRARERDAACDRCEPTGRLAAAVTGPGIGATVIRESGDIDVHIVTHAAAGGQFALPRITGGALSVQRRVLGFALALIGGPLLTWLLVSTRSPESITSDVLAYQLLVVLVALVGGIWPALFAAVLSGLTLDFLFVAPVYSVEISDPLHALRIAALRRQRGPGQLHRRSGGASRPRRPALGSRGGTARHGCRERAARRERGTRACLPHA